MSTISIGIVIVSYHSGLRVFLMTVVCELPPLDLNLTKGFEVPLSLPEARSLAIYTNNLRMYCFLGI